MSGNVLEIEELVHDSVATRLQDRYQEWNNQRATWKSQKKELRDYLFALDTHGTTNAVTSTWRHTTHIPKLCQIRDNLHANYMSALFPREDYIRWEAYSDEDNPQAKASAIKFYMANKTRRGKFREVISQLLYDYIDYGNCFAEAEYIREYSWDEDGNKKIAFQGPVARRLSPYDVVFNPIATDFDSSPQFVRVLKTVGELQKDVDKFVGEKREIADQALTRAKEIRVGLVNGDLDRAEVDKSTGFEIDGFGSYSQYLESDFVEILIFRGDLHDQENGVFLENHTVAVIDRTTVLYKEPNPSWMGLKPTVHAGWRSRSDNIYAMGPLDNLVGMQYMIDHLQNIKADMFDIIALPPITIKGQVEEFEFSPLAEIFMGEDGEVDTLKIDATALQADTQIAILEQKMDEMAGAPKQAIGARTPGEKTAFEVQVLEQNSNKMFQEKVQQFEIMIIEPLLNRMLEIARRSLDGNDLIKTMDNEFGAESFIAITKEDLTTEGKIVPIGARHFAQRNQMVQNYQGFASVAAQDPELLNHVSSVRAAEMMEELLGFDKFDLVRANIRIDERAETQRLTQAAQQSLEEEAVTPADSDEAAVGVGPPLQAVEQ